MRYSRTKAPFRAETKMIANQPYFMKTQVSTAAAQDAVTSVSSPSEMDEEPVLPTASADPVAAEEVGHPVGAGIGAAGAGAAGAAIGAALGPLGVLVGAALGGAVAGGILGKEVAAAGDEMPPGNSDSSYTNPPLSKGESIWTESASAGFVPASSSGSLFSGADDDVASSDDVMADIPASSSLRPQNTTGEVELEPVSGSVDAPEHPVELIRTNAYYRYLNREMSGLPGDHFADWMEAEREMGPTEDR